MRVNYNGNFIEFPDNMSDDEINNALSELPSDFFVGQQDAPKIADKELRGAVSGIFDYSDNNAADVVHHGAVESQPQDVVAEDKPVEQSVKEYLGETADNIKDRYVAVGKGMLGIPETAVGLADIPTGGEVGKFMEEHGVNFETAKKYLNSLKSEGQTDVDAGLEKQKGFTDTVKYMLEHPSTALDAALESAPSSYAFSALGGKAAGLLKGQIGEKTAAIVGGSLGEGVAGAGQAAEGIRTQTDDRLLTDKQAGLALASGANDAVLGFLGGKVAAKFGFNDFDTIAAGGGIEAANKSLLKRVLGGAVTEGFLEELPQSEQEKLLENIALDKKDIFEGVGKAGAIGLLTGGIMGGLSGIPSANNTTTTPPPAAPLDDTITPDGTSPLGETIKANESPAASDNLGDLNSILKGVLDDANHQKEVTQTIGDEITSAENIDDAITKSNAVIDLTLQDATIHNAGTKADEDKAQLESEIDKDKQQSILNQQSITDDAIKSASEESKAIADADKVDALIDAGASLIGKFFVLPNGKKVVATKDQLSYAKDKLKQVEKSRSEIAPTELQTGTDETQERRSQNQINDVLTNDTEFNQTESATNNARVTPLSQAVDLPLVDDAVNQQERLVINESSNGNNVVPDLSTDSIDDKLLIDDTVGMGVGMGVAPVTYDDVDGLITKGSTPFTDPKSAKAKLERTKGLVTDEHDVVPITGGYAIAPTASLDYAQFKALPRNEKLSDDVLSQTFEVETGKVAPVESTQGATVSSSSAKEIAQKENTPIVSVESEPVKEQDGRSGSLQGDSVSNNDDEAYDSILTENKLPNGYSATILSSQPSKYGRGRFATTAEITRPDGSKYNESIDHYDQIPTGVYSGNKNYEHDDNGFIKRGSNKPITQGDVSNTPVDTKPNVRLDSTQAPANAAFKIGGYYMDSEGNAIIEKNTSNIVKNGVDSFLDVATDNKFPTLKSAQNYLKKHFNSDEYEAIGYSLKPKTYTIIKKSIDVPVEGKSVFTEGQTFVTATERRTSPYPATGKGDKSHNEWLKKESIEEANARGDSLRARIFEKHGGDGLYLFDKEYSAIVQPKKSILKDIDVSPSNQQPAAQTSSESEGVSRGTNQFNVGDTVYIEWTATGKLEPVNYRGRDGNNAVVVKDGKQMSVPYSDLVARNEPEKHYSEIILDTLVEKYGWKRSGAKGVVEKDVGGNTTEGTLNTQGTRIITASFDTDRSRYLTAYSGFDEIVQVDGRGDIAERAKEFNYKVNTWARKNKASNTVKVESVEKPTENKQVDDNVSKNDAGIDTLAQPTEQQLIDYRFLREFNGRWKYKTSNDSRGEFTADSKESAIEMATKAFNATPKSELKTQQDLYNDDVAKEAAATERRYGAKSIDELEKLKAKLVKTKDGLYKTGEREFNGNGGRRTAAAVSNEAARGAAQEIRELEDHIARRKAQEGESEALATPENKSRYARSSEAKAFDEQFEKEKKEKLAVIGELLAEANVFAPKAVKREALNPAKLSNAIADLMQLYIQKGIVEFKELSREIMSDIYERFGEAGADAITIDHLQGAYISFGQQEGMTPKRDVIAMDSIDELYQDDANETEQVNENSAEKTGASFPANETTGNTVTIATPSNEKEFEATYEVAEIGDITASHDMNNRINDKFNDNKLQGRDRTHVDYGVKTQDQIKNFNPKFLGSSVASDDGAPIITNESSKVISGNGRHILLSRLYSRYPEKAAQYKQWLMDNAQSFGLDADVIAKMDKPILVRRKSNDDDLELIADKSNVSGMAEMSALDRAFSDARQVNESVFLKFKGGEIEFGANLEFVRAFNEALNLGGSLTATSLARMKNAIMAHAYGDYGSAKGRSIVEGLSEEIRPDAKSILNALFDSSSEWVLLRAAFIATGTKDFTNHLVDAVHLIRDARANGKEVKDMVDQYDIETMSSTDPFTRQFVQLFFKDANMKTMIAQKDIAAILKDVATSMTKQISNRDMFDDTKPLTPKQILENAYAKYKESKGKPAGQIGLIDAGFSPFVTRGDKRREAESGKTESGQGTDSSSVTDEGREVADIEQIEKTIRNYEGLIRHGNNKKAIKEFSEKVEELKRELSDRKNDKGNKNVPSTSESKDEGREVTATKDDNSAFINRVNELKAAQKNAKYGVIKSLIYEQEELEQTERRLNEAKNIVSIATDKSVSYDDRIKNVSQFIGWSEENTKSIFDDIVFKTERYLSRPNEDVAKAKSSIRKIRARIEEENDDDVKAELASLEGLLNNVPSTSDSIDKLSKRSIQYLKDAVRDKIVSADDAIAALNLKMKEIEDEPANRTPESERSVFLFKPQARKKLDEITWAVDQILKRKQKDSNVPSTNTDLERDSTVTNSANSRNETPVFDGSTGNDDLLGQSSEPVKSTENVANSDSGDSISIALTGGEQGDNQLLDGNETDVITSSDARDSDSGRSGQDSINGMDVKRDGSNPIKELPAKSVKGLKAKQVKHQAADLENVKEAMPFLNEGQADDVVFAEKRFEENNGVMFTNGTGTGKTFTGLGIVSRFANQGKNNILIVAPSQNILDSWLKTAKNFFDLNVTLLADTKDAGAGIVATTYANFGDNVNLVNRDWDLIVTDEAHYLMSNAAGSNTAALDRLRGLTGHEDGFSAWFNAKHSDLREKINEQKQLKESKSNDYDEALHDKLDKELHDYATSEREAWKTKESKTKVTMLSATPFAYESNIDYANGYLFEYGGEKSKTGAYNSGSGKDKFFMQHLGYRMRYNKLTKPDAKVDRSTMQRQFNENLKKTGAVSARTLDVPFDYDRQFILTESAIGQEIDRALQWLSDNDARELSEAINESFDHLARRYLLEAIKAKEIIPVIKEHLAAGRKVLVFHDYKKGGATNPFNIRSGDEKTNKQYQEFKRAFPDLTNSNALSDLLSPIERFEQEFGKDALIYNGDVSSKERIARVAQFNDDNSGKNLILLQSASAKEGVSFHDTTGVHQRVLINIGLPTAPTTAIQQEGRIYRVGQQSDAIFRYVNTGTNWERWAFASTIAGRASEAENLALGEGARGLRDAFINAFENSDSYPAGHEGEGKGGKDSDKQSYRQITEMDRAKGFYYATQKKNSRTKSAEGTDYYATPEPVGLVMTRLADAREGEKMLEPSAGHGAIARWFRTDAERTAIEPSSELNSRLALVFQDGDIKRQTFEDLNIVNKFDAIVMNPPFGTGGKTAIEHLEKAFNHLRDGGRVVALIPEGAMADKRLDAWLNGTKEVKSKNTITHKSLGDIRTGDRVVLNKDKDQLLFVDSIASNGTLTLRKAITGEIVIASLYDVFTVSSPKTTESKDGTSQELNNPDAKLVYDISLPTVTFERAGTKVKTHIVVIEKTTSNITTENIDLSGITDINQLFDRLDALSIDERVKPVEEVAETPAAKAETNSPAVESFAPDEKENFDHYAKISADSLASLRKTDLDRVLEQAQDSERSKFARYIASVRPDLFEEIHDIMKEDYGKENWHIALATKTVGTLVEGKHTKTGEAIFTVKTPYNKEAYSDWSNAAKRFGGFYSRYTKGFLFKTKDAANQFMDYLSGSDNSEIKYSYAGAKAQNANQSALARAVEMQQQGVDNETIRKETGWFLGMDDKWRFEISDDDIQFIPPNDDIVKLSDILKHDKLYQAYPELKNITVEIDESIKQNGTHNASTNTITLQSIRNESTLIHEVQHAIQSIEGFATGGASGIEAWANIESRKILIDYSNKKLSEMTPPTYEDFWGNEKTPEGESAYQDYLKTWKSKEYQDELSRAIQKGAASEVYRLLAGEIEARDTQSRMNLTDAERKQQTPYVSQGISKEDAIVRFGDGVANSEAVETHTTQSFMDKAKSALDAKFGKGWFDRLWGTGSFEAISNDEALRMVGEDAKFHKVWHGSPHDFDKFSLDNIGTGEGAQAYGYGLYFAGGKDVAEWYRDKLSKIFTLDGIEFNPDREIEGLDSTAKLYLSAASGNVDNAISELKKSIERTKQTGRRLSKSDADSLLLLENFDKSRIDTKVSGKLFEVELAPSQDEYLLWDKPLSEQSEFVKKVLKGIVKNSGFGWAYIEKTKIGASIYGSIRDNLEGDKAASDYIHSVGIRGIKYLDGTSRSKGDGNYNYVIFDDNDITIEAKYSKDGKIEAFYNPADDKVYFVPENISKDRDLRGLALHEIATHMMRLGKNQEELDAIFSDFESKRESNPLVDAAFKEAKNVGTPSKDLIEEAFARLVDKHPELKLSQRFIAWFKQAVRDFAKSVKWIKGSDKLAFIQWANKLNEKDWVYMATSALRSAPENVVFKEPSGRDSIIKASKEGYKGNSQREAKEWLRAVEKGLDMSFEARMERAKAMGFDVQQKWYHGTKNKEIISEFDSNATREDGTKTSGRGSISFTSDPRFASGYAGSVDIEKMLKDKRFAWAVEQMEAGYVMPIFIKTKKAFDFRNPADLKKAKSWYSDFVEYNIFDSNEAKKALDFFNEEISSGNWGFIEHSLTSKVDGLNFYEAHDYEGAYAIENDTLNFIAYQPENIRSIFAAFDPDFEDSANLLASKTTSKELLAPNGKPSNLNAMQHAQVRTPEFLSWFGDWINDPENASKVVDENGEPLVVKHASKNDITHFKAGVSGELGAGIYFSTIMDYVNLFGNTVYSGFINAKKPLILNGSAGKLDDMLDIKVPYHSKKYGEAKETAINELLDKNGYDAILTDTGKNVSQGAIKNPNQIKSATGNNGDFSKDNNDIRYSKSLTPSNGGNGNNTTAKTGTVIPNGHFEIPKETTVDKVRAAIQNDLLRLKTFVDAIKNQGGVINDNNDFYQATSIAPNIAAASISDFKKRIVDPLFKRMADLGVTQDDVGLLAYAKHAAERNDAIQAINDRFKKNGGGSGMTNEQAQEIIDGFKDEFGNKFIDLENLANHWQKITVATRDILEQSGDISPETAKQWRDTYDYYVPLKGFEEVDEDGNYRAGNGVGKGFSTTSKFSKRALGRESRAGQILENIERDLERAIIRSTNLYVAKTLAQAIDDNPDTDLWEKNVMPIQSVMGKAKPQYHLYYNGSYVATRDTLRDARRFRDSECERTGQNKKEYAFVKVGGDAKVTSMIKPVDLNDEIVYFENGKQVRIRVYDKSFTEAFNRLADDGLFEAFKLMSAFNRMQRHVLTTLYPAFIIANGFMVDPATAFYANTGRNGFKFATKAFKNSWQAAKALYQYETIGTAKDAYWQDMIEQYRRTGGSTGVAYVASIDRKVDEFNKALARASDNPYDWKNNKLESATNLLYRVVDNKFFNLVETLGTVSEQAQRLSTYAQAREEGLSQQKAAVLSQNVTVNFGKRGQFGREIGATWLFSNAGIQGIDNFVDVVTKGEHKKQAQALLAASVAAGFLIAMLNGDDGDDDLIPETEKQRYIQIPLPFIDGVRVDFKLPYSNSFFFDIGRAVYRTMAGGNKEKIAGKLMSSFFTNFMPLGNPMPNGYLNARDALVAFSPQITKLFTMLATNRNAFGSDLMPENIFNEHQPDSEKAFRKTRGSLADDFAKSINRITGGDEAKEGLVSFSPESVKATISFMGGGFARTIFDTVDALYTGVRNPDELKVNQIPVLKNVVKVESIDDYRRRMYSQINDIDKLHDEFKSYEKSGNKAAITDLKKESGELLRLSSSASAIKKQIKDLRDDQDKALKAGNTSRVKSLETKERIAIMNFNKKYQKASD